MTPDPITPAEHPMAFAANLCTEVAQLRAALAEACALLLAVNKFDRIECDNPTVLDSWFEQRNEFLAKHGGAS